jgi:HEAT repeat protein
LATPSPPGSSNGPAARPTPFESYPRITYNNRPRTSGAAALAGAGRLHRSMKITTTTAATPSAERRPSRCRPAALSRRRNSRRSRGRRFSLLVALCGAIACGAPGAGAQPAKGRPPAAPATTPTLITLDYSGPQQPLDELDREIARAGTDVAQLDAIANRLLGVLRQRNLTFAARQAVCQRLGFVLLTAPQRTDAAALAPLAAMLANDQHADLARLALEPVPGEVVDTIFVQALGKAAGHARLAVLQSLAARRISSAVPVLAPLLDDADSATAAAAVRALGAIGGANALAALRKAPHPQASPVAEARLAAATRLPAREARPALLELRNDAALPAPVRTGAFRTLLELDPRTAPREIAGALAGQDPAFKPVALEAIAAQPPAEITRALVPGLASWDPPTQAAVVTALGRHGHAAAVPAARTAASHADPEVRRAALEALGRLPGSRDIAGLLARVAAGEDRDDARVARQSLARLNGSGVAAAVLAGAERGDSAQRVVFLEQIGLRNMPEGIPLLLNSRQDADAAVRAAALGALGDLAAAADLPKVLEWTLAATDTTEQSRGLRALVAMTARDPDPAQRGQAVYEAIETAPAEGVLRLLPVLARIGGAASAECAARLALRDHAGIADAATDALARWPDRTALLPLASVAESSAHSPARAAAAEAALRTLERNREAWTPETTQALARILTSTSEADVRTRAVALLARANDPAALQLAVQLQSDQALAEPAGYAAAAIRANLAGRPAARASDNTEQARNIFDGKTDTRWSVPTDGGEWLEIDLRIARPIRRLTLDQSGRTNEYPERYEVYVADDLQNLGPARTTGEGQRNRTVIDLPAEVRGRYVVIKNTAARPDSQWTVSELWVD